VVTTYVVFLIILGELIRDTVELFSITHAEPEKLADFHADLLITALSHESRSLSIPGKLEKVNCRKVVLCAPGATSEAPYNMNYVFFRDKGYEVIPVKSGIPDVGALLKSSPAHETNILCDCTSMSPLWYFELFRWFSEHQEGFKRVRIRFVYTIADYVDEGITRRVTSMEDYLKPSTRDSGKKKALVLGLGQEASVSDAIVKIIKPDILFLFYADPPADKRFVDKLLVNNHALIQRTPIRNLVAYPIQNGQIIYQKLVDTILPLRNEYAVSLVPVGPKIFSVASMLVQLGYPEIMLSYPLYKRSGISDRKASGEPVVLDICFTGDE
jgi:hypothetical protein